MVRQRIATALAAAVVLIAAFLAASSPLTDSDLYYHLRIGRHVLETGTIPSVELWSHTARGEPVPAHDWGFGVIAALWHRAFSLDSFTVFKGLAVAALAGLLFAWWRRQGLGIWLIALLALALLISLRFRFMPRPQLATMIGAAALMIVFESLRERPRVSLVAAVGLIEAAWSCLHKGSLFGFGIAGAFGAEALLDWWRTPANDVESRAAMLRRLRLMIAAGIAVPAGFFAAPFGWQRLAYTFHLSGAAGGFEAGIGEFLPLNPADQPAFYALLALTLLGLLTEGRRARVSHALMVLVFGLATARWSRLAEVAVPLMLLSLAPVAQKRIERWAVPPTAAPVMLALLLTWSAFASTDGFAHAPTFRLAERGRPAAALAYADRAGLAGPLYNDFYLGAYLLYTANPRWPVFWDARSGPYNKLVSETASMSPAQVLERFQVSWAILESGQIHTPRVILPLNDAFLHAPWVPVFFDDVATIFVRQDGPDAAVAARDGFHLIKPWLAGFEQTGLDVSDAAAVREAAAETRRALLQCGGSVPWVWASSLALMLNRMDEAETAARHAVSIAPDSYAGLEQLGRVLIKNGKPGEAVVRLRAACRLNADRPVARLNLGTALLQTGRAREALREFERALALRPDWTAALFNQALALETLGRRNEAIEAYRRIESGGAAAAEKAEAAERRQALVTR